ncbi:MAG TPA: serine hydrolase [Gaiellaceae bacterium]|nr:serine hydrolase [Gaiellaceae bacterium]
MRALKAAAALVLALGGLPLGGVPAAASQLPSALDDLAGSFAGGSAVWVSDPTAPLPIYARNADEPVVTASLYKLAVLAEAEHQVELGTLHYTDTVEIGPDDITMDGSNELEGTVLTLDQALEQMITVSDNGPAIHLWRILGPDKINSFLVASGISGFHIRLDETEDNTATARSLGTFFTLLAERKLVSPAASDRMLARLERQQINDRIPVQLPPGTVVAHKTGNLIGLVHDAGIVYTPRGPRVVVVMTWDSDEGAVDGFIARLTQAVYDAALATPLEAGGCRAGLR